MKRRSNTTRVQRMICGRRGATMLFALFLFLICVVVGSVILTAGTAAGGRRSQIVSSDQRFYSVDSAAAVFCDMIGEQSVTVVREEVTRKRTRYSIELDEDGKGHRVGSGKTTTLGIEYYIHLDGSDTTLSEDVGTSMLAAFAADLIEGCEDPADVFDAELPCSTDDTTHQYELGHSTSAIDDPDVLDVRVSAVLDRTGDLYVTFSSAADENNMYSVTAIFRLRVAESESVDSKKGSSSITADSAEGDTYTESYVTTTTDKKKTTFRWVFDSMDIVR